MKGKEVITALKRKFRVQTDKALADTLGLSTVAIQNWKNRSKFTLRQLVGLVHSASNAGAANFRFSAIRPLVEFFQIDLWQPRISRVVFSEVGEDDRVHPYADGLRKELDSSHGVYVFFDSRGQAIYVGKARTQTLWKEINLALNRDRRQFQKIKKVDHPERKVEYRTSDEKVRQIRDRHVPLWEIASYFSAYEVADGMIEDVEALLVRSFANNLLNKRMEKFARHRRSSR